MSIYNPKNVWTKKWLNNYSNHNMCGMVTYTLFEKKSVTDVICV
jgi:hypothetical protein